MKLEIEATFVDVDKKQLRKQLKHLGAKLVQPEILMRRVVFDTGKNSFARVRDEGKHTIFTYKKHHDNTLTGTEEINVKVNNYEDIIAILKSCGLKVKAEQETYRESWQLDDAEIDIDTWPWLPSYVEIEGPTVDTVKQTASKLGFDMKHSVIGSVDEVYKLYYDVSNDDINFGLAEIKFTNAPDWLAARLRREPLAPARIKAQPIINSAKD